MLPSGHGIAWMSCRVIAPGDRDFHRAVAEHVARELHARASTAVETTKAPIIE